MNGPEQADRAYAKLSALNGELIKLLKKDSLVAIVLDESFARQYRADALNQLLVNEYRAALELSRKSP